MECEIGSSKYRGYCVPNYFTTAEKDAFVDAKERSKKRGRMITTVVLPLALLAIGLFIYVNVTS